MRWFPHDLGTWSLILSVAAIILALPLGIAGTLLAPKVQLWWFLLSVKGKANKLISLTAYREEIEKEPMFSPTETLIYEQQVRLMLALHLLAYLLILAHVFIPNAHSGMTFAEAWHFTIPAVPVVSILFVSVLYFGFPGLLRLQHSSPKARRKLEVRIDALIRELRKIPPTENSK